MTWYRIGERVRTAVTGCLVGTVETDEGSAGLVQWDTRTYLMNEPTIRREGRSRSSSVYRVGDRVESSVAGGLVGEVTHVLKPNAPGGERRMNVKWDAKVYSGSDVNIRPVDSGFEGRLSG